MEYRQKCSVIAPTCKLLTGGGNGVVPTSHHKGCTSWENERFFNNVRQVDLIPNRRRASFGESSLSTPWALRLYFYFFSKIKITFNEKIINKKLRTKSHHQN